MSIIMNLKLKSIPFQRWPDRLWGWIKELSIKGNRELSIKGLLDAIDAISDHYIEFYIANLEKNWKERSQGKKYPSKNKGKVDP